MMLRSAFVFAFGLSTMMAPLAAQAPDGWRIRVDRSANASDPDDVPDLKVVTVGKGFRATGGPAGTFWNPANRAAGNYTVRATFNLMKPSGHTNYYGLVFGGSELEGAAQKYVYFLVAQDGTFIIRSRAGEQVQDVQARTAHAAVQRPARTASPPTRSKCELPATPFPIWLTVRSSIQGRKAEQPRRPTASPAFASTTCSTYRWRTLN